MTIKAYLCEAVPEGSFTPVEGDFCPYCGAPLSDHETAQRLPITGKFEGGIVNPKSPPTVDGTTISREV